MWLCKLQVSSIRDTQLNLVPKSNSCENFSICNWILNSISAHNFSKMSLLGTFKKYVRSRFPSFDAPPPLFVLVCFRAPPPTITPTQGTFVLARTRPLPLNFYTCETQRQEINEYQYLWLNSTCLLRSQSGISIKWTRLVHGKSVHFMEMSFLQRVHLIIRCLQK